MEVKERAHKEPEVIHIAGSKEDSNYYFLKSSCGPTLSEQKNIEVIDSIHQIEVVSVDGLDRLQSSGLNRRLGRQPAVDSLQNIIRDCGRLEEEDAGAIFFKLLTAYLQAKEKNCYFEVPELHQVLLESDGSVRFARYADQKQDTNCSNSIDPEVQRLSNKALQAHDESVHKLGSILRQLLLGFESSEDKPSGYSSGNVSRGLRVLLFGMMDVDVKNRFTFEDIVRSSWYQQELLKNRSAAQGVASKSTDLIQANRHESYQQLGKRKTTTKIDELALLRGISTQDFDSCGDLQIKSSSSNNDIDRAIPAHRFEALIEAPQELEAPFFDLSSNTAKFNIIASQLCPKELMSRLVSICYASKGTLQESTQSYKMRYDVDDEEGAFNMSIQVYRCSRLCSIAQLNLVGGCMFSFRDFVATVKKALKSDVHG